jgi:hypothetical protein
MYQSQCQSILFDTADFVAYLHWWEHSPGDPFAVILDAPDKDFIMDISCSVGVGRDGNLRGVKVLLRFGTTTHELCSVCAPEDNFSFIEGSLVAARKFNDLEPLIIAVFNTIATHRASHADELKLTVITPEQRPMKVYIISGGGLQGYYVRGIFEGFSGGPFSAADAVFAKSRKEAFGRFINSSVKNYSNEYWEAYYKVFPEDRKGRIK